jgi:hypothetical protein
MAATEKIVWSSRSATVFHPRTAYGIALADRVRRIVRSWRRPGGRIQTALCPEGDPALRLEWARRGVMTVGCLPVHESLTVWLATPLTKLHKAEKVLPSLLDIQLPFPLETCVFQFVEYRKTKAGTITALVCAAQRESVRACLEKYRAQGVDPVLLDHEGLALWTQSLLELPGVSGQTRVILFLEQDHAVLVSGVGTRYGEAHSAPMPAAGPAGLLHWLQRILRADLTAGTAVQWVFCGAKADDSAVVKGLHEALAREWPGPLTVHETPATFLARALGGRVITRGFLRCNLRRGELIHASVRRATERRAIAAAVLVMLAGLFLCGLNLAARLAGEYRFKQMRGEVAALAQTLAPGVTIPYGRETAEAQKVLDQRAKGIAPFMETMAPSLAVRLAEIMRLGQTAGVHYETLTIRRNGLIISGTAVDWNQCDHLEQRLKALGYAVTLERQEAVADTTVRFTVTGQGGGP